MPLAMEWYRNLYLRRFRSFCVENDFCTASRGFCLIQIILKKSLTSKRPFVIITLAFGRLAQLARASAWRAEGHRFESYIVHQKRTVIVIRLPFFSTKSTLAGGWNHLWWWNPPFGRMKSRLAVGGFNFIRISGFHLRSRFHPCESKDFII